MVSGTRRTQVTWTMACIAVVHGLFSLGLLPRLRPVVSDVLADRDFYIEIARNLAAGRGYAMGQDVANPAEGPQHATLRRMPAYPLLLAALERTVGTDPLVLFLVQLGLIGAACLWVYAVAARESHAAGLLAMLILGAYPLVVLYTPRAYSETLLVFFVSGTLYGLMRFLESGRGLHLAAAAALAAGAWLTRSTVALWLVPAAVIVAGSTAARGRRVRLALLAAGVFALLAVPWVARNWRVSGSIVPGTTWNARSALAGLRVMTHPEGERRSRQLDEMYQAHMSREMEVWIGPVDSPIQEVRENGVCARLFREEALQRPGTTLITWARGFFRVFFQTGSPPMRVLIGLVNLLLALLAVAGAALGQREAVKRRNGETAEEQAEQGTSSIEPQTSNLEPRTSKPDLQSETQEITTKYTKYTKGPELQSDIRCPKSDVRDPMSEVRDPMSDVRCARSDVQSPRFQLRTPHSALLLLLWWLLGTSFVFYSVVYPLVRYMMAALPVLAILAGWGGARLARRWFGSDRVDAFTTRL